MGYYLCLDCGNIYNSKYFVPKKDSAGGFFCPKNNCGGVIFEIDEWMIEPIKKLNQKGYITTHCCSGHFDDAYPYIRFDNDYFNQYNSEYFPKGWEYDNRNSIYCLRYKSEKSNIDILYDSIKSLIPWIDKLPSKYYIPFLKSDIDKLNK